MKPFNLANLLLNFSYYYPLFMAYLWMIGAIYYYFHWEKEDNPANPPKLPHYPPVSIIVPCHNEGDNVRETINYLLLQEYPNFEIIAIDDGSTDNTGQILDELEKEHDQLRVVHFKENKGKAVGLHTGALLSPNEFLITIDGDALLAPSGVTWIMRHFLSGPRVGAVTGNPRIRTRSTLLGKIQVGEFSAIIGLMKRAQRIYGRVFTISGVVSGFRKSALHRVGYWSTDMIIEDIDISWKLQLDHWSIRFEPCSICWILMPETLPGIWAQRLRWARGGCEVIFKYFRNLFSWRKRRMWPVFIEIAVSGIWAYIIASTIILWLIGQFINLPAPLVIDSILPGWYGVVLGFTCLLQFIVGLIIDSRYEKGVVRYYYWMVWYPLVFWMINMFTTIIAFPITIFTKKKSHAVWVSPDRGYPSS